MKRLALAFLLLPSIALAQQQQINPTVAGAQSMALDGAEMFRRMAGQIAQDQDTKRQDDAQMAALRKQVADVTAERDKLKAAAPVAPEASKP